MNRRNFTKATVFAGMGISKSSLLLNNTVIKTGYKYNLHYAPHIGMFKNHAGSDPIDQLNFMADLCFTAFLLRIGSEQVIDRRQVLQSWHHRLLLPLLCARAAAVVVRGPSMSSRRRGRRPQAA